LNKPATVLLIMLAYVSLAPCVARAEQSEPHSPPARSVKSDGAAGHSLIRRTDPASNAGKHSQPFSKLVEEPRSQHLNEESARTPDAGDRAPGKLPARPTSSEPIAQQSAPDSRQLSQVRPAPVVQNAIHQNGLARNELPVSPPSVVLLATTSHDSTHHRGPNPAAIGGSAIHQLGNTTAISGSTVHRKP